MSSIIEQAAQRLEQIRAAGIEIPESGPASPQPAPAAPAPARAAEVVETDLAGASGSFSSKQVELDLDVLMGAGYVLPSAPRTRIADQFRVIKRPLIDNATAKGDASVAHGNLIMVTSAVSGEGKSFTAINLALSIAAELDHTVMLVDADVARPSILRKLGLESAPGLLEVLEGKVEMADALLRTNIPKLTLLPSGQPHPKATELLASESMRRLLDDMASRYADRIIIFDSPPLLLTTESRVLATHMGQVVVVVNAGKTLQADVVHALATIESCPIRMMLLNKTRSGRLGAYGDGFGYGYGGYGQSYGYGYGYGYGRGADGREEPASTGSDHVPVNAAKPA